MFKMKFLDGTPVDPAYATAVSKMIHAAAESEELIGVDSLEWAALKARRLEEKAYVEKHNLRRLTFAGGDDLYETVHGAHTIRDTIELDALQQQFWRQQAAEAAAPKRRHIEVSEELSIRNERHIDEHGFAIF
jgi:hypothetical protein